MLKALLAVGALQLATMLLLLVRTKLLALLLGPANLGLLGVIDKLVAVVAQTASLSLSFAALRYLSPLWNTDRAAFDRLFTAMRNVLVLLAGTVAVFGAWVGLRHPGWFGAEYHAEASASLAFAFLTLPVVMLVPFVQSAIAARMQQAGAMRFTVAHAAVSTAAAIAGTWAAGLPGLYAAYAVCGLVLVGVMLWRLRTPRQHPRFPLRLPRPMMRFSGALLLLTFVVPYGALYLHYQVLRIHGAEAAGWMHAALGLALAIRTCMGAAQSVFLTPNVNRHAVPAERMRWVNAFQRGLCMLLIAGVPPLVLFPDLAVRLLYSAAFAPAAAFVALFVAVEAVTMLSGSYQALIVASDRLGLHVAQNLAAQLLMIGTGALLVPRYGIAGAALAALTAPIFLYGTTIAFLRRELGLRVPADVTLLSVGLLAAVAAAGLAGVWLPELDWTAVLTKLALYLTILLALFARLSADERMQLQHVIDATFGRLRPAARVP